MKRKTQLILTVTMAVYFSQVDDSIASCHKEQCDNCVRKLSQDLQKRVAEAEKDEQLLELNPDKYFRAHPGESYEDALKALRLTEQYLEKGVYKEIDKCVAQTGCNTFVPRGQGCR
jgi:hypothetical protein